VPCKPAATNVQAVNVPEPPLLVAENVNDVVTNAVIVPSMKLAGVAVSNTLTRCPTVNAVAVVAKLVVNENDPELAIVALEVDVNPE
jgi:hypothetical protein